MMLIVCICMRTKAIHLYPYVSTTLSTSEFVRSFFVSSLPSIKFLLFLFLSIIILILLFYSIMLYDIRVYMLISSNCQHYATQMYDNDPRSFESDIAKVLAGIAIGGYAVLSHLSSIRKVARGISRLRRLPLLAMALGGLSLLAWYLIRKYYISQQGS